MKTSSTRPGAEIGFGSCDDGEELGAGPEHGVADVRDLRAVRVPLEDEDEDAPDCVDEERRSEDEAESRAQVQVRRRACAHDVPDLADSGPPDLSGHGVEYRGRA